MGFPRFFSIVLRGAGGYPAFMKVFLIAICTASLLFQPAAAAEKAEVFKGKPYVIDGDTLRVKKKSFRLYGIDAPEHDQICLKEGKPWPCGKESKLYLIKLAKGGVSCEVKDRDRYKRFVAVCSNTAGEDINAAMVKAGLALAYRHYSEDYVEAEKEAKDAEAGLWGYEFTPPENWRHPDR